MTDTAVLNGHAYQMRPIELTAPAFLMDNERTGFCHPTTQEQTHDHKTRRYQEDGE